MALIDPERLAKLLEMTRSPHAAEALTAISRANEVVLSAGLTWKKVVEPVDELRIAADTVRQLIAENEALKTQIAELLGQRRPGGIADDWRSTGNPAAEAAWVLGLQAAGIITLIDRDRNLAAAIQHWPGQPGQPQCDGLAEMVRRIIAETGEKPPP